jgi:cytochrome c oxidase accessory protein FixG
MNEDFREVLYTIDKKGNRKWVYPSVTVGAFWRIRRVVSAVLIVIYLSLPWITIGNHQAVRIDLAHRTLFAFGSSFWASDTVILWALILSLAFSLLFFTSLFGRVWCGWACPETVFLEFVFRPIERLIEGNARQRAALDSGPWNRDKVLRKSLKFGIFTLIAWFLASTALAYFVGRQPLIQMMSESPLNNLTPFLATCALTSVLLFQFGWFREQFCSILCPYARFQSVLLDRNSLAVTYDESRGEPRGKPSKEHATGDCVNCRLCVKVCPTGIDIRNGLQLECIQCTACIDACNSVMSGLGKPLGLIRYTSEAALESGRFSFLRPRVGLYALLLSCSLLLLLRLGTHRSLSDVHFVREGTDTLFTVVSDHEAINHFRVHVSNKSDAVEQIRLNVNDNSPVQLISPLSTIEVPPQQEVMIPLFFKFPIANLIHGKLQTQITSRNSEGVTQLHSIVLIGPERQ